MYWIGLLSGTSADAADAALIRIESSIRDLELLGFCSLPFPDELRARIHAMATQAISIRDLARLDHELGERFAEAAVEVATAAGLDLSRVAGIGSHGQTVGHFPEAGVRSSVQLGAPAVIHERTGVRIFADFRRSDLAAGGQGAPLTPFFHQAYFASADEVRALLNIGGFTNVSYLPGLTPEDLIAFDPGPGNALLDRAARWASKGREPFDRDGAGARRGTADSDFVQELLDDPYFAKKPPKSTGHEYFGRDFFERTRDRVLQGGGNADDLLATLSLLTVESVVRQAQRFFRRSPARWIVYGGGVRNTTLLDLFRRRLAPAALDRSDAHGIPADALEAITFAVLGWCASRARPGNLPAATGARRAVVLGSATPP